MTGKPLNETEVKLTKQWLADGVKPSEIAERLGGGRDKRTINRNIKARFNRKKTGRKRILSEAQVSALEK